MIERRLPVDTRFDPGTQPQIGLWVAGLEDQSRRLLETVEGLDVPALSWQPGPGHNTIGSLIAHSALVELAWIGHVAEGRGRSPETAAAIEQTLGVTDDAGFLVTPGGGHPAPLAGWALPAYRDLLTRARDGAVAVLRTWTDDQLHDVVRIDEASWSRAWMLYHVLEHLAAHLGQIRRLLHDLRDAGLVDAPAEG